MSTYIYIIISVASATHVLIIVECYHRGCSICAALCSPSDSECMVFPTYPSSLLDPSHLNAIHRVHAVCAVRVTCCHRVWWAGYCTSWACIHVVCIAASLYGVAMWWFAWQIISYTADTYRVVIVIVVVVVCCHRPSCVPQASARPIVV